MEPVSNGRKNVKLKTKSLRKNSFYPRQGFITLVHSKLCGFSQLRNHSVITGTFGAVDLHQTFTDYKIKIATIAFSYSKILISSHWYQNQL